MNIPFPSLKHAGVMRSAVGLLDRVESQGIKDELVEKIRKQVEETPTIYYPPGSNRLGERYREERPADKLTVGGTTVRNPYSKMEMKAPYSVL